MYKIKKCLCILLALALICGTLMGCGAEQPFGNDAEAGDFSEITDHSADKSEQIEKDALIIVDIMGRESIFREKPETFVVANYIFNFMLIGGSDSMDHVVGLTKDGWEDTRYGEYTVLTNAFPKIKEIPSIGGYHDDVLDTELILEMKPDCLLINSAQYTENELSIPIWEGAGIHVVVLDYHKMILENHLQSTEILGQLLGKEEAAESLCSIYQERMDMVNARIAALPEDQKHTSVYVELGNMGVNEIGNSYDGTLWGSILDNIQALNIAKGILPESYGPLDMEYILEQDPKIIIIGGSIWSGDAGSDQMRMGFTVDENLAQERLAGFAARPEWRNMRAVEHHEVYGVDHGSLRSILDYTFTEYLAKVVYPTVFEDIDPAAEYEEMLFTYLPEIADSGTFMIQLET